MFTVGIFRFDLSNYPSYRRTYQARPSINNFDCEKSTKLASVGTHVYSWCEFDWAVWIVQYCGCI